MKKLFLAVGFAACCMAAHGQAGSLDLSFAMQGYVLTQFPGGVPTAYASSAVQPDGKIVTAGTVNDDFAIARYNVDGTLDNSFSGDGMMTVDFGFASGLASDVAIQPDGKIVVVGTAGTTIVVVRLNPDGSIDNSFSEDGRVFTSITGNGDRGRSVVVQPDGKILVLGSGLFGIPRGPSNLIVLRYNSDGTLDTSFSGDGIMRVSLSQSDLPADMLLQPDGKIVVIGTTNTHVLTPIVSIAVARLNSDGSFDPTFGGGVVITDIGFDFANAAALQADGKIVVAGSTNSGSGGLLLRYNPDGSLDNSFSGDGKLIMDPATGISGFGAVAIQPDGKIIASSAIPGPGLTDLVLVRFNPDGTPDNSFSGDGIVVADFENHRELINSLNIWNNRLYAVGTDFQVGIVAAFLLGGPSGFSCPPNAVANTAPGLCVATVNNLEPTGLPAGASLSYSLSGATTGSGSGSASGLQFNSGATTVTYSTTNPAQSCSFTVTVRDLQQPQASYPQTQNFCRNSTDNYLVPPLQVSDNCGLSSITFFISGATARQGSGTDISGTFLPGNNFVTWTIRDLSGNQIFVFANINISEPVVVTIPDAMTLNNGVAPNTVYTGYQPASDLTLSAGVSGGTAPYTYLWSNGATTPTITVSPSVPATYTVTVTDALGCSSTASKFVNVIDVRCGNKQDKVLICKVPKGKPSNAGTNCISANAVDAQLANGSYLGNCSPANSMVRIREVMEEKIHGLSMKVLSNPAANFFTLVITTGIKTGRAELVVKDLAGRQVEKRMVMRDGRVQLGGGYGPGVYVVELRQGNGRVILKLIKLGS